jgi:hypothetical protein
MNPQSLAPLFFVAHLALAAGCASDTSTKAAPTPLVTHASTMPDKPQNPDTQPQTAPAEPLPKPFMFSEAALPDGFPPPGPVNQIIIKQYPSYRMARVDAASLGSSSQNRLFGTLFDHIKKNKIAMTAPVEMTYQGADAPQTRPASMAFMYKSPETGPTGTQGKVIVTDIPAMTVLSISLRGSYSDANHAKAIKKLQAWLAEHPNQYKVVGPTRYLGYNSPFVPPFLQIGEAQIPIAPITPAP